MGTTRRMRNKEKWVAKRREDVSVFVRKSFNDFWFPVGFLLVAGH